MLAINISEVWPCIFGKYTNIIAAQIHLQCVSIKPSSQIKVTFSFQFQQVDPTRCLQKSPPFCFLQLWSSLLGLASPAHILKNWFHGPLRSIFITMVHFLISQDLLGLWNQSNQDLKAILLMGLPCETASGPCQIPDTAQWPLCQLKVA